MDEVIDTRVAAVTVDATDLLTRVRCAGTLQGREITFDVLEGARRRFAPEGIDLAYRYRNHVPKPETTSVEETHDTPDDDGLGGGMPTRDGDAP